MDESPLYNVNILGLGNVGFEIVKDLLRADILFTEKYINQVNQCHRTLKKARDSEGKLIINDFNSLEDMIGHLGAILSEQGGTPRSKKLFEERFVKHPYWPLEDLDDLFENTTEQDITIITTRYTFKDIDEDASTDRIEKIKSAYGIYPSKNLLDEINTLLKLRSNIIASSYGIKGEGDILIKQKEIRDISKKLDSIIDNFTTQEAIDIHRIENIRYALFGIKELACYLKEKNYRGLVIMVTNPIDEAAHIFRLYYEGDPRKVIGLSDNERGRWEHYALEKIKQKKESVEKIFIPVNGFHNEYHSGLLGNSFYQKKGENKLRSLSKLLNEFEWKEIYEKEKDFGLREYEKLKSSAPDTAIAVINILKAYVGESPFPLRGSCFEVLNGVDMSIGRPFVFINHKETPLQDFYSYAMSGFEKGIIEDGIEYETAVLKELKKYGLIERSIDYQPIKVAGDYSFIIHQILGNLQKTEEKKYTQRKLIKDQLKDPSIKAKMHELRKIQIKNALRRQQR